MCPPPSCQSVLTPASCPPGGRIASVGRRKDGPYHESPLATVLGSCIAFVATARTQQQQAACCLGVRSVGLPVSAVCGRSSPRRRCRGRRWVPAVVFPFGGWSCTHRMWLTHDALQTDRLWRDLWRGAQAMVMRDVRGRAPAGFPQQALVLLAVFLAHSVALGAASHSAVVQRELVSLCDRCSPEMQSRCARP